VLARGPQDVIRTILGDIEAKGTAAPMPAVGNGMTDDQIAEVTNYVRQAWGNTAPPNAGAGMAGDLWQSTIISLYGPRTGECPAIPQADLAAAVADPKTGISEALHEVTMATVVQTVEQVVPKVKAAVPNAQQADVVNGLTLAYCPIRKETDIPDQQKPIAIGQFSDRVYSELPSNGKN
jgi:hypothetical protein